jgi:hypothetical protein
MSNQETQQTRQEVYGWVDVRSFMFYKLDKNWVLEDVMDEIVKRLDDVVREKWDELYSPGYRKRRGSKGGKPRPSGRGRATSL